MAPSLICVHVACTIRGNADLSVHATLPVNDPAGLAGRRCVHGAIIMNVRAGTRFIYDATSYCVRATCTICGNADLCMHPALFCVHGAIVMCAACTVRFLVHVAMVMCAACTVRICVHGTIIMCAVCTICGHADLSMHSALFCVHAVIGTCAICTTTVVFAGMPICAFTSNKNKEDQELSA